MIDVDAVEVGREVMLDEYRRVCAASPKTEGFNPVNALKELQADLWEIEKRLSEIMGAMEI